MAGVDEERAAPAISSPSVQKATDAGEDDPVERYMRATRARARAIADHPLLRALRARVTTAAARVAASPQYAALGELLARSLLGACLSRLLPCVWWWGEADAAGWMFEGGRATGVEVRAVWLAAWSVVGSSGGTADVRGATLNLVPVRAGCRGGRRAERAHATWVQNVQHPSDPQRPGASGPCHSCSSRPNPTAPQQQQKWRWKSPERAMRQQIDRAVKRAAEEQANPLLTPLQTGSSNQNPTAHVTQQRDKRR